MSTADFTTQALAQTITYPMDIINAMGWYITLPTPRGVHGAPDTVTEPKLATYSDEFFQLNATKDGAVFKAPTDGATTKKSFNPRSELREMTTDGKTQAAWSSTSGTHSMEIVQAVIALPIGPKPVVVTGQIHDANDDVSVFRVEANRYDTNTGDKTLHSIWITDGNTTHGHLLTNSYRLGDQYTVGFQVAGGKINYTFNGQPVAYAQSKSFSGAFFKVGSYCQSGGIVTKLPDGPEAGKADYAAVTVYSVQVCHNGVCTGNPSGTRNGTPEAVITASATNGTAPLSLSFDGSHSTTPNGNITTYSWDFGDSASGSNHTATGVSAWHTYASAGSYTATLTVSDAHRATDSASIVINVATQGNGNDGYNPAYANLKIAKYTKPTQLKAKVASGNGSAVVTLSWKAAPGESNATIVAYKIYEKNGSGSYTYILAVSDLQASIIKAMGSYSYEVSAVYKDKAGALVESPTPSSISVRVK